MRLSNIASLVADMYATLTPAKDGGVSEEVLRNFAERTANHVKDTLEAKDEREREPRVLYASEVGERCTRKLYYKLSNVAGESIPPHTYYKFLYGDIVEETALLLAEASGHRVEDPQLKVVATFGDWQVRGRQDATIDGVTVDVKSMSQYGMDKLTNNLDDYDDPFGYVDQVSFYRNYGPKQGDGDVAILGVDKTLGHIKLSSGCGLDREHQDAKINATIQELSTGNLPARGYLPIPEGKSGNQKMGVSCSYCAYKKACYPGLRTFLYSKGPVFLTEVVVEPKVPELHNG